MVDKKKRPANRDEQGRFVKGKSGNPSGRPAIPEELKVYGREAPAKLQAIAADPDCPMRLKADIYKWFSEMIYGKPKQQLDMDAKVEQSGTTKIEFEGVLDEWSK